jgi:hypothetical protein
MFLPLIVVTLLQATQVVLENEYVRVTKNAAPCAAAPATCGDRVLVALGDVTLPSGRAMKRGDLMVFKAGEPQVAPASGTFVEVAIKPTRPAAKSPAESIAPEKNAVLFDGDRLFIFEEKLAPGETRARHTHRQRVVIVLNETRLQQWPDGQPELFKDQVPDDIKFNEPVIHVVKNVGRKPLRNIVIELKNTR